MKTVLVSQRVEVLGDRGERRDCLDQRIPDLLARCGLRAVAVPNVPRLVDGIWAAERPAGVVLTGGNDLAACGGDTPERDETEHRLLKLAVAQEVPVLGICRGLQSIVDYFGGLLAPVSGHVAVRHHVTGAWGSFEVNSFHGYAPSVLPAGLTATMTASDGQIEALAHDRLPIRAVMWHPEREPILAAHDEELIEDLFGLVPAELS